METIWSTIALLGVMVAVIIGAYFTTRLLSNRSNQLIKNKYIHIVERFFVAKEKQIMLIEVGGKFFLVGVSNQGINVIGTFDKDEIETETLENEDQSKQGFVGFFMNAIKKGKANQDKLNTVRKVKNAEQTEFDDILDEMNHSLTRHHINIKDKISKKNKNDLDMGE